MWRKIIHDYRLYYLNDFFEIKWIFYCLSCMLQLSQFVWALSYSVWDIFNKFLLIDATDRSKFSSDQKRFFIALSLNPLSFFANTPFNYVLLLFCYSPLFQVYWEFFSYLFLMFPFFFPPSLLSFHTYPCVFLSLFCINWISLILASCTAF